MNYHNLGSRRPIHKNIYRVPIIPVQHQEGHTVSSLHQAGYNARESHPKLLSKGALKWDIPLPPSTSQFDDPIRSFKPNLDLPTLSDSIRETEICFPRAMKSFSSFSIHKRYSSSSISIKDILEITYQYFMQLLIGGTAIRRDTRAKG